MPRKKKVDVPVVPTEQVAQSEQKQEEINEDTPVALHNPALDEVKEPDPPKVESVQPVKVEESPKYIVEGQGVGASIFKEQLPTILAGVCEYCGGGEYDANSSPQRLKTDWTVDPISQVGRCRHYRGVKVRCAYCPQSADWVENIKRRKHWVFTSAIHPGQITIVCSDMICRDKHLKRETEGKS